jgi:hypothetical protein
MRTFRKLGLFCSSGERKEALICWVPWKELTSVIGPVGPQKRTKCENISDVYPLGIGRLDEHE